jgi:flagellar hook-length control protein FliK
VDIPVGEPDWDKAVGDRIQWMLGRNIQSAELKLTPPHLGPLEIRISVQQDQASVSFMAAHLPTREALEAAIPRLREMFGETNLNLVDVGVGQGGGSDTQPNHHTASDGEGRSGNGPAAVMLPEAGIAGSGFVATDGLVDDYA